MFIFILAMIQSFLYAWVLGIEKGEEEAHQGAHLRIPRFVQYILKYVTPVYLAVIFIGVVVTQGPTYVQTILTNPVARMSVLLLLAVLGFLCLLAHLAGKRWQAEGRFEAADKIK